MVFLALVWLRNSPQHATVEERLTTDADLYAISGGSLRFKSQTMKGQYQRE